MSQSKFREQNIAIANILAASTPHASDIDPDYMPEPILLFYVYKWISDIHCNR